MRINSLSTILPQKLYNVIDKSTRTIDWRLLVFLVLVLNIKLVVKLIAVILIYILRPDFHFKFKLRGTRLPLFYPIVAVIAILNFFIFRDYLQSKLIYVLIAGLGVWGIIILISHQLKLSVEQTDPRILHNTMTVFFLLNVFVSALTYISLVLETGSINLYQYQGDFQKYFIGTGDMIKGISFDTSTTNAFINGIAVLYFLSRGKFGWAILCMITLLFTGSNFTNLLLIVVLLYVFITNANKIVKSVVIVCFVAVAIFLTKVSPENNQYIINVFKQFSSQKKTTNPKSKFKADSGTRELTFEEQRIKFAKEYLDSLSIELRKRKIIRPDKRYSNIKVDILKQNLNAPSNQRKLDTSEVQRSVLKSLKHSFDLAEIDTAKFAKGKLPGKILAFQQTINFLKRNPSYLPFGTGMGNFSSKLAFRTTGIQIAGSYPKSISRIDKKFRENHLLLWYSYFSKDIELHSVTNTPNSVYDQMLSEYGLVGILALVIFYFGFFAKKVKSTSYLWPVLFFMAGSFVMEYWFEQLSIVLIFELLLFFEIKEQSHTYTSNARI